MRRIAYLIPTIDRIGGAERQVIQLAIGMTQRGWNATVIALSGNGGGALAGLREHGPVFLSLEMRKGLADPRGWMRLHGWLASQKPDVVHAHLAHATLLARWSRPGTPVRVLIDTIHSPATGGWGRRIAHRVTSWIPDAVTAVSEAAAEPWLKARMVHRSNLAIVPNGIDPDYWKPDYEFREQARRASGVAGEFVWLAVGRLDPVKDHATLLRAFARIPAHARLLIAGGGPLESKLRRLSSELGIEHRVDFLGFQEDIRKWMRQADAFVLSSRWEGMPLALLEACACELPAVITDTPGARQVLRDPGAVPVGDPEALAEAMSACMSLAKDKRLEVAKAESRSIAERFSLESVLDRYERLYEDALAANARPIRWRTPVRVGQQVSACDR
jgi:glycosyltransferase involved in cell wall biosynthesis